MANNNKEQTIDDNEQIEQTEQIKLRTKEELIEEIKNRTGSISNYDQVNRLKVALSVVLDELEAHRQILEPEQD